MCTGREVVIAPRVVHTVLLLLQTVLLKISYLLSQCKSIINFFIEWIPSVFMHNNFDWLIY
jgi:hypothetical protein